METGGEHGSCAMLPLQASGGDKDTSVAIPIQGCFELERQLNAESWDCKKYCMQPPPPLLLPLPSKSCACH